MPRYADGRRIRGAAAFLFLHLDLLLLRPVVFSRGRGPPTDLSLVEIDRTQLSVQHNLRLFSGIHRRGALDHPIRPALERNQRHRRILHLDIPHEMIRLRVHRNHRIVPHQPQQEIHAVHALIHQRAASVQRPRAAPTRAVVIFLRAIILQIRIRQHHLSQIPAHHRFPHLLRDLVRAPLKDAAQFYLVNLRGPDHRINLIQLNLDGLLAQHVHARLRRCDHDLRVRAGRGAYRNNIHVLARHQLLVILVKSHAPELLRKRQSLFLVNIAHRHQLRIRAPLHTLRVPRADHATAHDPIAQLAIFHLDPP